MLVKGCPGRQYVVNSLKRKCHFDFTSLIGCTRKFHCSIMKRKRHFKKCHHWFWSSVHSVCWNDYFQWCLLRNTVVCFNVCNCSNREYVPENMHTVWCVLFILVLIRVDSCFPHPFLSWLFRQYWENRTINVRDNRTPLGPIPICVS